MAKEKFDIEQKSSWLTYSKADKEKLEKYAECYKKFLTHKTVRKVVNYITECANKKGFKENAKSGAEMYFVNRNKNVAMIVAGKKSIEKGLNIIVTHIDCPRIDLKPKPFFEDEDSGTAILKTHYYGGIKKYQWANVPLALYGSIVLQNSKTIDIECTKPVFVIPDLLPHLAEEQLERKLKDGLKGEELNLLAGSIPENIKNKNKIKTNLLNILYKKHGIREEDLISAEIEAVPAYEPQDIGFDCSLIGAYGQDDRSCAYAALTAILELKNPERWCLGIFIDKEEIGSEGATSMKSKFMENVIANFADEKTIRRVLENSKALSGDVNSAISPTFKDVYDISNCAKLGYGVVITKYTGRGGKYYSSDASAEYVAQIRKILNLNKIPWQCAELGKVDIGGGGTVAKYLAEYNMDIVDIGPPIMSMHSPYEISSKADIYSTYLAYKAFYNTDF